MPSAGRLTQSSLPPRPQALRRVTRFAERSQTKRAGTLGESLAVFVAHQRAMKKGWRGAAQCEVQQQLPRGGSQQIFAAHYLADLHRVIVVDYGQLVTRIAVFPPDDEVAKIDTRHARDLSLAPIDEANHLAI